ncbi:hypothetical protein [Shewanella gaetbuli]|uniref:Uncharacterized protein n=1 Tax=Shewanella gaetbuli TaxID=220752 RepID=A0A9X1ZP70_9GAMM|nr:hypothetical protein [Shewanella gaetbuli]MCL1143550.1 hypothetical protein [Shewanella gaetbuli]
MRLRLNRALTFCRSNPFTSVAASAVTTTLVVMMAATFSQNEDNQSAKACACKADVEYNTSLPSSHPNNRCALEDHDVSWKNWITGNSRSNQFHFIDLIELLYGHKDKPIADLPNSSHPEKL